MNSGSDGDVSDEGNSDNDENSVFSDDEQLKHKKRHKVKKLKKSIKNIPKNNDETTLDLFNVNSNSHTDNENYNAENTNDESPEPGLCLRLDSIEEDDGSSQDFTKTKEFKSPTGKPPSTEESSQSSFSFHMTSDPEVTNESCRIQPAQGGGNNRSVPNDSENNELMSMFPKISKHINGKQMNTEPQNKKVKQQFYDEFMFILHHYKA